MCSFLFKIIASDQSVGVVWEEEGEGGKSMKIPALQRLIKSFKGLSQRMVFRDDDGEDDDEMKEMVIGFPTDVQHVGHIGWDGTSSSLSTLKKTSGVGVGVYLKQFELAMAAHASASASARSDFGEFPNTKLCSH